MSLIGRGVEPSRSTSGSTLSVVSQNHLACDVGAALVPWLNAVTKSAHSWNRHVTPNPPSFLLPWAGGG